MSNILFRKRKGLQQLMPLQYRILWDAIVDIIEETHDFKSRPTLKHGVSEMEECN